MPEASAHQPYKPRICVCVLMNHPYPKNIPIIRRLYRGRFSKVVFVMPFERSSDPDVFTVYRGGYSHAAFITDVHEKLMEIDCDYYFVIHDDVLLNPILNENNFLDYFPLAPDDGFIPSIVKPGDHIGHHPWYPGVVAKLLFPKSQLFGSGMDAASLVKYMPPVEQVRAKLDAAGVPYQERVKLDQEDFYRMTIEGSRILLHGHAVNVALYPHAEENNEACVQIIRQFIDAMALGMEVEPVAGRLERGMKDEGRDVVLPFPLTYCAAYGDFYILPRSKLNDYAHYMGVWCGTNALIEFAIPTILHIVCDRVWTAEQAGLEFSFFSTKNSIAYFRDPKFVAIHPYKFSQFSDTASRDTFFAAIDGVVRGEAWPPTAQPGPYPLNSLIADFEALGWHGYEGWGRWAISERATIPFRIDPQHPVGGVAVTLQSPLGGSGDFTGTVRVKGRGEGEPVFIAAGGGSVEIRLDASDLNPDGLNEMEILSGAVVRPCDLNPDNGDNRTLGFGLVSVVFLEADA